VEVVFTGTFQNDQLHRTTMRAMAETLEGTLQRTLREDLGGTYGVNVRASSDKRPADEYRVTISFGCDPERMDALVMALFRVIDRFKATGPSTGQIGDVRAALIRDLETNSRDNRYLLVQLKYKYEYGEDPADVFAMRKFYDQLSVTAIRDAARAYLDTNRYVKVTLMPAAK
jgi:zinc protease